MEVKGNWLLVLYFHQTQCSYPPIYNILLHTEMILCGQVKGMGILKGTFQNYKHTFSKCDQCMLPQVGVKYGGEDIPGSPFPMSSNPSLDDVTSGSPEKMRNNKNGEEKLCFQTLSFSHHNGNRSGEKAISCMLPCIFFSSPMQSML